MAQQLAAMFPAAKLLSSAESTEAMQTLTARLDDVTRSLRECTVSGEEGRALVNAAQREIITITRLLDQLGRRYVLVLPSSSRASSDLSEASERGDDIAVLAPELADQVALISEADLDEDEGEEGEVLLGWDKPRLAVEFTRAFGVPESSRASDLRPSSASGASAASSRKSGASAASKACSIQ